MPSKLFWKCECGIEWQALQSPERRVSIYRCMCGRRRTFSGKAISLYYAPIRNSTLRPVIWKEVVADRFKIPD
jgi:hypothetical protein